MAGIADIVKIFYSNGKNVEAKFANDLVHEQGGEIIPSTEYEDAHKHIDLFWKYCEEKRKVGFDVKGARKRSRYDKEVNYDSTWLELQNVNGQPGSMYGEADYIVFEGKNNWLITNRKQLLDKLLTEISDDTLYTDNPKCYFKKYQRAKWGRNDIIVEVPVSFLEDCTVKKIRKIC